jgi:hypothetical protein
MNRGWITSLQGTTRQHREGSLARTLSEMTRMSSHER